MIKNKKGFTLVELLSVMILLIIIVSMVTLNYMPSFENGKKKSLVDEAFVISEGGLNKYSDDRLEKVFTADLFNSKNANKRCYSIKSLFGKYVSKSNKNYHGSLEICTGDTCTYKTKIWLSDGEYYLTGKIVDDTLSADDMTKLPESVYFDTCGIDIEQIDTEYLFDFTATEQSVTITKDGLYSLEAWGAQGGDAFYIVRDSFGFGSSPYYLPGGKGGYSYTEVELKKGETLYITVGGLGPYYTADRNATIDGGYNGGGKANYHSGGGGGATHIALKSGAISSLKFEDILLVAGGGGAGYGNGGESRDWLTATNGGGYCNSNGYLCFGGGKYGESLGVGGGGGIYTSGGAPLEYDYHPYSWGGADYFYTNTNLRPASYGGIGYIGNPRTKNGVMYVLNTNQTNMGTYTKTINTTLYSSEPIENYAKEGNGFARVRLLGNEDGIGFGYIGEEKTYTIPQTGKYKLEVWGASGGEHGYGGYAVGEVSLNQNDVLYINVGGKGITRSSSCHTTSSYNGGGKCGATYWDGDPTGGGGATHIALRSGLLASLENHVNDILIVAGGGGGDTGNSTIYYGGSGGGFKGVSGATYLGSAFSTGGTQSTGYAFGVGSDGARGRDTGGYAGNGGSGGGFYGGKTNSEREDNSYSAGAGGSGYIGNSRLTNKAMYCFSCEESNNASTKTFSTQCINNDPKSNCSKYGDGYARITFISE